MANSKSTTYLTVRTPTGRKRIHVVIAEKALGKTLPPGAQVHHVDGNKHNNANTNLVICQDAAYHNLLHARTRVRDRGGNTNTDRICTRCECVKPLTEFYADISKVGGIGYKCKDCGKASANESMERRRTKPKRQTEVERITAAGGDPLTQWLCGHCQTLVLLTDLYLDKSSKNGRDHFCKPCRKSFAAGTYRRRLE